MAIARVTLKCTVCGKEFEIRKECGNRSHANSYEDWAANHIDTCYECRKAAKIAEETDKISVYNLPYLTGTEKQAKWAGDIRRRTIADLDRTYTDNAATDDIRAQYIKFISIFGAQTDSRYWIDNRYNLEDRVWVASQLKKIVSENI